MAQNRIPTENLTNPKLRGLQGLAPPSFHQKLSQSKPPIPEVPARYDSFESSGENATQLLIHVLARNAAENADAIEETVRISEQDALLDPNTGELVPLPKDDEAIDETAEDEEEGVPGTREKDDAAEPEGPGGNVLKTTVEEHCYCEGGSHDKAREGSEECYAVVTKVTDQQGNPVDSPERGKRKALNELEN